MSRTKNKEMMVLKQTIVRLKTFLAASAVAVTTLAAGPLPAGAQQASVGPLVPVSPGRSPYRGCTADKPGQQEGTLFRNAEIEPFAEANPADPDNLIAVWQQDRWSNGASRGNASARSTDGGATWTRVVPPGITLCQGGSFDRASDPWVSYSPNGTAYFMHLATDEDLPNGAFGRNGMLVNRSTNGGRTWSRPITLIQDPPGQALNDKNSLTADPTNSRFAYAVWDRLVDFTIPDGPDKAVSAASDLRISGFGMDGLAMTRERVKRLKARAKAGNKAAEAFFKGPIYFVRTTNGGQSWERPKVIYDPGPNSQTIGNLVQVLPNGDLLNIFIDISSSGDLRLAHLRSKDKGATFAKTPKYIANKFAADPVTPDSRELIRSGDILFDAAVDPNTGAIYLVWEEARFSGVNEVAFVQSTDGGVSWSTPTRINRTPRNANPLRQQALTPSVAVAENGTVVVDYYDFRFDGTQGESTDRWAIFCRPSLGTCQLPQNWRNEKRLTKVSFDMREAPVARGYFLGDYQGLTAVGNVAHSVFGVADFENEVSLVTRRITLGSSVAGR